MKFGFNRPSALFQEKMFENVESECLDKGQ